MTASADERGVAMDVNLPVVRCSECGAPWVLRLPMLVVTTTGEPAGKTYLYSRDCRHKKAEPTDPDGETAQAVAYVPEATP